MDAAIHINPAIKYQLKYGEYLKDGFKRHNIKADVTCVVEKKANIHVILGPYYAKPYYLGRQNVVLLDRAHYQKDPVNVSIGWMNKGGGRDFVEGEGRKPPEIADNASGDKTIFLADYNGKIEKADTIRHHPAQEKNTLSLVDELSRHRKAIGYDTTALVTAALNGLEVETYSKCHILNQSNWLNLLPYADWHYTEIENGDLWAHLRLSLNQLPNR